MEIHNIAINIRHEQVESWNFMERHVEQLRGHFPEASVALCHDDAEFESALPSAELCLVWRFRQEYFEMAPNLKVVSTPAAGRDYFTVTPPLKVRMLYGQFHGEIIGETVVGMLLAMTRGIVPALTKYAKAEWPRKELCPLMRPLRGSHVVILGFGHVGEWIGRLLKPFGVRISGLRRSAFHPGPDWFDDGDRIFDESTIDEILPTADHLILSLPGGIGTDNFLNGHRITLLKPSATIINVGRGNAIESMSLFSALSAGRIAGAFLDVFPDEPLPKDSFFRQCPNLWRMPHASAISVNYLDLYVKDLARQMAGLEKSDYDNT